MHDAAEDRPPRPHQDAPATLPAEDGDATLTARSESALREQPGGAGPVLHDEASHRDSRAGSARRTMRGISPHCTACRPSREPGRTRIDPHSPQNARLDNGIEAPSLVCTRIRDLFRRTVGDCPPVAVGGNQVHSINAKEVDQYRHVCRCDTGANNVNARMSLQAQGFPDVQQLTAISSQKLAQFKQPTS